MALGAPRSWATGAEESCTTSPMTGCCRQMERPLFWERERTAFQCELNAVWVVWKLRGGGRPAVLEAVALAVHLQDVDVVGETVQQRPGLLTRGKLVITKMMPL